MSHRVISAKECTLRIKSIGRRDTNEMMINASKKMSRRKKKEKCYEG